MVNSEKTKNQTDANKKWQKKNKEYSNYLIDRSKARGFIKKKALVEDLDELSVLIDARRKELEENNEL